MKLLTCANAGYYDFLNVLIKSNKMTDQIPVIIIDWGLEQWQLDELNGIDEIEYIKIDFPIKQRMLCKVLMIKQCLDKYKEPILYLDADFFFRSGVGGVLKNVLDIAITWLDFRQHHNHLLSRYRQNDLWLNAGFFFCQYNIQSSQFVNQWLQETTKNKQDWWGDQDTLTNMTKSYFPDGNSDLAHITYLPCSKYNCVPDSPFIDAKLIHMKGEHWHKIVTNKVQFPTKERPERLRPLYEEWLRIRQL